MKRLTFIFCVCSAFFFNSMHSQETKNSYFSDTKTEDSAYIGQILNQLNNNNLTNNKTSNQPNQNQSNIVALNQVGFFNQADIASSKATEQNVNQVGNNNYYGFVDYYNTTPVSFELLQKGNDNSVQIYGTNSIINGMKIVQRTSFKNITIKNY